MASADPMNTRLVYLCVCQLLLVAGVAMAGRLPSTTTTSVGECYETVKKAPKECAGEFIQAVFTGKKELITEACCVELACVREWTCATVLRGFCLPPEANQCDPAATVYA